MSLVLPAFVQFLQFRSALSLSLSLFFFFYVFIYADKKIINMRIGWGTESGLQEVQNRTTCAESKGPSSRPQPGSHIEVPGGVRGRQEGHYSEGFATAKWVSAVITRNDSEEEVSVHPNTPTPIKSQDPRKCLARVGEGDMVELDVEERETVWRQQMGQALVELQSKAVNT